MICAISARKTTRAQIVFQNQELRDLGSDRGTSVAEFTSRYYRSPTTRTPGGRVEVRSAAPTRRETDQNPYPEPQVGSQARHLQMPDRPLNSGAQKCNSPVLALFCMFC